MRSWSAPRSRFQRRRLLLVAVTGVIVAVAACAAPNEVATEPPVSNGPGDDARSEGVTTELPPSPARPEPALASAGRSPAPPGDPAAVDATPRSTMTLPAAVPLRLQVPSIGVDTALVELGLDDDGTLEVPAEGFPAGWYVGAPTPGELGPAIIAGHVDFGGQPGVFFDLRHLTLDDGIEVTRSDGSTARFRVTRVDQFDKDAFPTAAVYGDLDHAGLRLITCGGSFDPATRSYDDNLVVFAELVGSGS